MDHKNTFRHRIFPLMIFIVIILIGLNVFQIMNSIQDLDKIEDSDTVVLEPTPVPTSIPKYSMIEDIIFTKKGVVSLPLGHAGEADDLAIGSPSVLRVDDTYYLWYGTQSSKDPSSDFASNGVVLTATSKDGINWEKVNNSAPERSDSVGTHGRIPLGTSGKGDDDRIGRKSVIYDNGIFKMWYLAMSTFDSKMRVYYATSKDGINWEKYDNSIPNDSDTVSTNGRLSSGLSGSLDEGNLYHPYVFKDERGYFMYYASDKSNDLVAFSNDGISWSKLNSLFPAGKSFPFNITGNMGARAVQKYDDFYFMIYEGYAPYSDGFQSRSFYTSYSKDMILWNKIETNIEERSDTNGTRGRLPLGTIGAKDSNYIIHPSFIIEDSTIRLWYIGSYIDSENIVVSSLMYAEGKIVWK